jgi:hypothetical protein
MPMRNFGTGDTCRYCMDVIPHCTWCENVIGEDDRALSFVRTRETLHIDKGTGRGACLAEYSSDYDTAWYQDRD